MSRSAVTRPACHEIVPTVVVPVIDVLEAYGSKNDSASVPSGALTVKTYSSLSRKESEK